MRQFRDGELDILVATAVVEVGIDVPNAAVMLIDGADRFGLSQLYQLRGRVGRGDHRAYAYLLLPRGRRITGAAEKRIEAILEASDLGSGFRIAMRDMEIRGAGNLLGAAQSGNMHAVGMDLYGQLLQEAVAELFLAQGKESADPGSAPTELPRVELPLNASIPEAYLPHMATRLSIYQRLARIQSPEEAKELGEELRDRFGPPPPEVEDLLALVDLRLLAGSLGVESVTNSGNSVLLVFREPVGSFRVPLQRALGPSVDVGNKQMRLSLRGAGDQWLPQITRVMQRLQVFQQRLQSLAAG
jgi:transcription-repair coupling factor (superfamily II helicase)